MKKAEIIEKAKNLAKHGLINPYIPDVLSDGSTYANEFLEKLSVAENENHLERLINETMC